MSIPANIYHKVWWKWLL